MSSNSHGVQYSRNDSYFLQRESEAVGDAPAAAERVDLGDGGVYGSWEGQLDCKTGWTGKNGKNSCNSRKIAGNKQDVRRNYNKTAESM